MQQGRKLISAREALDALGLIRCQKLMRNQKSCAGAVGECMEAVAACAEVRVEETRVQAQEADVICALKPWWPGAKTGRMVKMCGRCETDVERRDRYCGFCGRLLKWDGTDKKRNDEKNG